MKLRDFKEIGKAFSDRFVEQLIASAEAGNIDSVTKLYQLDVSLVPKDKRLGVARALYSYSKRQLALQDLNGSIKFLKQAQICDPQNQLFLARIDLLRAAIRSRDTVQWRLSLHKLQRDLRLLCNKGDCRCQSHFQIATCKGLIDGDFAFRRVARDLVIYTLGAYHARSYRGGWTKLLKAIKHFPYRSETLEPMADILADFIIEATPLLGDVDVLVPIPPSTRKFAERRFAPNDIVASRLSTRLALPVRRVLLRHDGPDTEGASDAELATQFEVGASQGKALANLSVLLVEDIWTRGRTLPICAGKLQQFQPKSVFAVALAKTGG